MEAADRTMHGASTVYLANTTLQRCDSAPRNPVRKCVAVLQGTSTANQHEIQRTCRTERVQVELCSFEENDPSDPGTDFGFRPDGLCRGMTRHIRPPQLTGVCWAQRLETSARGEGGTSPRHGDAKQCTDEYGNENIQQAAVHQCANDMDYSACAIVAHSAS